MPKTEFNIAVGCATESSFLEVAHARTEKEAERTANMMWQAYELKHDKLYVIAWDDQYSLDYETMHETVVYFRCRPGLWITEHIAEGIDV
jgi:hypothetical protein